jgi:hypothetical protein
MRKTTFLLCAAACLLTAGCNRENRAEANDAAAANEVGADEVANRSAGTSDQGAPTPAAPSADCPITDVAWHAEVNSVGGKRMLEVTGDGMASSGGWQFTFEPGVLDKSSPPTQHFTLTEKKPSVATGNMQPFQVKSSVAAQPLYKEVVIDCGGVDIAHITKIDRP